MISYSQWGQDIWVVEELQHKKGGYFVEAGAGDGVRLSNTYILETLLDWSGICIEPYQPIFNSLKINRKCICVQCCLADSECDVEYTPGVDPIDHRNPVGYRGGIIGKVMKNKEASRYGVIKLKAKALSQLLEEYNAPQIIDYLSLDIEGAEELVLHEFPFNRWSFQLITLETPTLSLHKRLLNNYVFVKKLGEDNCYRKIK